MENQTTEPEATQADLTPPKTVPLNAFPAELYRKLHPGFEAWNKDRIPQSPFSGYLIYLLSDPENIGQQLADRDSRIAEILRENERLESEVSRLNSEVGELSGNVIDLKNAFDTCESQRDEYRSELLELKTQVNTPIPEPVKAPVFSGKYNETAMLAAVDAVMTKAAELTGPGIFNKFQTYSIEDFRAIFREAYAQALPK